MSFRPEWLALREPFDHRARSGALADGLADALAGVPAPWRIVELAAGTGSGIRWLRPRLPQTCDVWALDHDPALLDLVPSTLATPWRGDVRDPSGWPPDVHAVTLQALLDLVDLGFLERLAEIVVDRGIPVLAALTVDGRVAWDPAHPDDEAVQAGFRLHQLGDRGFGASVGPFAAPIFEDLLRVRGYRVDVARSDWKIEPSDVDMLEAMIAGKAGAARELVDDVVVDRWAADRQRVLEAGELRLTVGHRDVLGRPAPP